MPGTLASTLNNTLMDYDEEQENFDNNTDSGLLTEQDTEEENM